MFHELYLLISLFLLYIFCIYNYTKNLYWLNLIYNFLFGALRIRSDLFILLSSDFLVMYSIMIIMPVNKYLVVIRIHYLVIFLVF